VNRDDERWTGAADSVTTLTGLYRYELQKLMPPYKYVKRKIHLKIIIVVVVVVIIIIIIT
jgi:hypothetical protein